MVITSNPDISRLLVAGRKAALAALYDQERNKETPGRIDRPPDSYDGTSRIMIVSGAGLDIRGAIDAAVLEVVVQIGNPEAPASRPPLWRRGFSIFWRSYVGTLAWGLPAMIIALLILKAVTP